jgi:hypothetical protein
MNQASRLLGCLIPLLASIGCRDLDRFNTRDGEVYCGSLVGQTAIATGFAAPEWLGTSSTSTLALTLNASELSRNGGVPAVVTSNDAAFGPCKPDSPLFDKAKVRTIAATFGDRLSVMSLSEDHEQDAVTFVDSTCSGSMVAILSLIQNGDVELRLLRPAPAADGDPEATVDTTARFGLFVLKKTKDGCGF